MKVPAHIVGLYLKTVRRYKKLTSRLNGRKRLSGYHYHTLLSQLKKLRKKIADLQLQLKIATASGALILTLGLSPAEGQTTNGPFSLQPRHANPMRKPYKFDGTTYPAIVDLDKDGDFDLVVGDEGDYYRSPFNGAIYINPLRYFVNRGTNAVPEYEEKFGVDNPFDQLDVLSSERGPAFTDFDQDGDEDFFVGLGNGRVQYFKNNAGIFQEQLTAWDPATKTGNPFFGANFGNPTKLCVVDFDKDGDPDVLLGVYVTGPRSLHYLKNNGTGGFTLGSPEITLSPMPTNYDIIPTAADIDADGDLDLVFGGYYTDLRYYKQVSPNNFVEQTGAWDPGTKTGNPFDHIHEPNTQPQFVDIDNDQDLDLLLGDGDGDYSFPFPNNIIHLFENTGNAVFVERPDLENPLSGIDAGYNSSPVIMDLDGDNELDALIGNKYQNNYFSYNSPAYYESDEALFRLKEDEENPFEGMEILGPFYPEVADVDNDGDFDVITGDYYGLIHLYRNAGGVYTEETGLHPFSRINAGFLSSLELADLDGDTDLDLVVSTPGATPRYFENTGTATAPQYDEQTGVGNPVEVVGTVHPYQGFLHMADVDHDGDLDILSSERYFGPSRQGVNKIFFYENTGTAKVPAFELAKDQPLFGIRILADNNIDDARNLQPYLADYDKDGDLDVWIGEYFGYIHYVTNDNPAVVASVNSAEINYKIGTDGAVIVDPALTLTDTDNDLIVQATVSVSNFQEGDELTFTPQAGITGSFNSEDGVLTFKGKAPRADYQKLLRTVAYQFTGEAGRKRPQKRSLIEKLIEFGVYDTDFTNPVKGTRKINAIFNGPPVFANAVETTQLGTQVTIDLKDLITDPDNNQDFSSLRIVQQPASGAFAEIDENQNLVIDYNGINFTGTGNVMTDQLVIEICDEFGECAQNLVTIEVKNLTSEIEIYNAVAPNSTGDNKFMRIHNLPKGNKVTIYNRWGDRIFEVDDYDNNTSGKRFEGSGEDGKALPSGTYFYKIRIPEGSNLNGPELLTGYISLKQ